MVKKKIFRNAWLLKPRLAEYFVFGKKGKGKNATIVTLGAGRTCNDAVNEALKKGKISKNKAETIKSKCGKRRRGVYIPKGFST